MALRKRTIIIAAGIGFFATGIIGFIATFFMTPPEPEQSQVSPPEMSKLKEMLSETFQKNKELQEEAEKLRNRHLSLLKDIQEREERISELQNASRDYVEMMKKLTKERSETSSTSNEKDTKVLDITSAKLEEARFYIAKIRKILTDQISDEEKSGDGSVDTSDELDKPVDELSNEQMQDYIFSKLSIEVKAEQLGEMLKSLIPVLQTEREIRANQAGIIDALDQDLKELKALYEDLRARNAELEIQLTGQTGTLEDALSMIEELEVERANFSDERAALENEIAALRTERDELLASNKTLEDEKVALLEENSNFRSEKTAMESNFEFMREKMNEEMDRLEESQLESLHPQPIQVYPSPPSSRKVQKRPSLIDENYLMNEDFKELDEQLERADEGRPELRTFDQLLRDNRKMRKQLKNLLNTSTKDRLTFYYNLGLAYTHAGLYVDAVSMYTKLLELDPHDAAAHYNLGIIYDEHLNKWEKGMEHYRAYLDLGEDPEKIRDVRNWLKFTQKKFGSGRETRNESSEQAVKRLLFTSSI